MFGDFAGLEVQKERHLYLEVYLLGVPGDLGAFGTRFLNTRGGKVLSESIFLILAFDFTEFDSSFKFSKSFERFP